MNAMNAMNAMKARMSDASIIIGDITYCSLVLGLGLAKLKFKGAPCAGLFFSKVSSTHANSLSTRSHVAPGGGWCLHLSLAQP